MKKSIQLLTLAGVFAATLGVSNLSFATPAAGNDFPSWREDAPTPKALRHYVAEVTNTKSATFIPVAERIAVFDMDGTLLSETTPSYYDWTSWVNYLAEKNA